MDKNLSIVVLYNIYISESDAYKSIIAGLSEEVIISNSTTSNTLLIFDNSTDPEYFINNREFADGILCNNFIYVGNTKNIGLAGAYNYAYKYAKEKKYDWLLLSDQDTLYPDDYFIKIKEIKADIKESINCKDTVAIVPIIKDKETVVSPRRKICGLLTIKTNKKGFCNNGLTIINTGSMIRIDFLDQLGGFENLFKVDGLDHWFYSMVFSKKKYVYIMNTFLQHELSIINVEKYISESRYNSILDSEKNLLKLFGGKIEIIVYIFQLLYRILKQIFIIKNEICAKMSFKQLIEIMKINFHKEEK